MTLIRLGNANIGQKDHHGAHNIQGPSTSETPTSQSIPNNPVLDNLEDLPDFDFTSFDLSFPENDDLIFGELEDLPNIGCSCFNLSLFDDSVPGTETWIFKSPWDSK